MNTQADRRHAAILVCRLQGCTCSVEYEERWEHGIFNAYMKHDDNCPLLRALQRRTN